jgi:hypothetical protein
MKLDPVQFNTMRTKIRHQSDYRGLKSDYRGLKSYFSFPVKPSILQFLAEMHV